MGRVGPQQGAGGVHQGAGGVMTEGPGWNEEHCFEVDFESCEGAEQRNRVADDTTCASQGQINNRLGSSIGTGNGGGFKFGKLAREPPFFRPRIQIPRDSVHILHQRSSKSGLWKRILEHVLFVLSSNNRKFLIFNQQSNGTSRRHLKHK